MEHSQKLNEAAEALLKEYGYNVDIVLDRVGNDRDFDPDYVLCRLAKDGQLMFRAEFRTELGNREYDTTGATVIDDCLDIRTKRAYQEQANKFDLKIAQLLKLKQDHKFTHRGEKKALKDECEELMAYREYFSPLRSTGVYANIPLIEENAKELEELAERIKEVCKKQEVQQDASEMA